MPASLNVIAIAMNGNVVVGVGQLCATPDEADQIAAMITKAAADARAQIVLAQSVPMGAHPS